MKKLTLTLIILIVLTGTDQLSGAQASGHTRGLYLTYEDYLQHKLSYSSDKIYLHEFLGQGSITVISNGKKIALSKEQVFGYHDNGHDYRYFGDATYEVLDTKGFYLYSHDRLEQQGKGQKSVRSLYFSAKADAAILPLTETTIEKAFAANHKFRYLVEAQFRSDDDLARYDNSLNEYKIKELYEESTK
jgi:hypothetical protein